MRKLIKHTLTGLAIGAKSLVPGGDAVGQETNNPISGGPIAEIYAPTVNYEAIAEVKLTNLIKLGKFGYIYCKAGILGMPVRSKVVSLQNSSYGEEGLSPLSSTFFGTGLDINLGERTKIGMGMDIRINKNGRAGKKTLIELRHNLEKLSMPNINAYINYKSADLNAHGSNEIYSLWRRGFGLGAEYEKQITDNLNFNARVGMSHNTFSLGGYYVGEESPLKFHTDIGLHYKIPPIKFGKLNLGSEIEPIPAPQPKRQKIKKPKSRRLQQISCPAHQRKPHERPVTIFNKP